MFRQIRQYFRKIAKLNIWPSQPFEDRKIKFFILVVRWNWLRCQHNGFHCVNHE